ncbi:MAG: hypothetical protein AAF991_05095 [Pseudomonadota bacterium]
MTGSHPQLPEKRQDAADRGTPVSELETGPEILAKIRSGLEEDAKEPRIFLLRLQDSLRIASTAFGLTTAIVVFAFLGTAFLLADIPSPNVLAELGSILFFASSMGMLAGFFRSLIYGAVDDLRSLRGVLPLSDEELERLAKRIPGRSRFRQVAQVFIAIIAGLVHCYFLGNFSSPTPLAISTTITTVLLWVGMMTTLPQLFENARLFSKLGRIANPDLLRPSRHAAFGSAALRPGLTVIGLISAYGLLFLGDVSRAFAPIGFTMGLSIFALVGLVALPLRGIRLRIRETRERALRELDSRLALLPVDNVAGAAANELQEIDLLLDMRERVAQAPGWPFDLNGVKRILFYIVLPPLTWAAAALVEMMIESAL